MSSNLEAKKLTYLNLNNRISKNSLGKIKCSSDKAVIKLCEDLGASVNHRVILCEKLISCESQDKAETNSERPAAKTFSQQSLPIKKRIVALEWQTEEPLDLSITRTVIPDKPLDLSFCKVDLDTEADAINA